MATSSQTPTNSLSRDEYITLRTNLYIALRHLFQRWTSPVVHWPGKLDPIGSSLTAMGCTYEQKQLIFGTRRFRSWDVSYWGTRNHWSYVAPWYSGLHASPGYVYNTLMGEHWDFCADVHIGWGIAREKLLETAKRCDEFEAGEEGSFNGKGRRWLKLAEKVRVNNGAWGPEEDGSWRNGEKPGQREAWKGPTPRRREEKDVDEEDEEEMKIQRRKKDCVKVRVKERRKMVKEANDFSVA